MGCFVQTLAEVVSRWNQASMLVCGLLRNSSGFGRKCPKSGVNETLYR